MIALWVAKWLLSVDPRNFVWKFMYEKTVFNLKGIIINRDPHIRYGVRQQWDNRLRISNIIYCVNRIKRYDIKFYCILYFTYAFLRFKVHFICASKHHPQFNQLNNVSYQRWIYSCEACIIIIPARLFSRSYKFLCSISIAFSFPHRHDSLPDTIAQIILTLSS